ncbi:MAG: HAD-IC family P-type ATPase, partial [Candidatus Competibacteraceae bacterium]|nr:HAD-IC family P-type ATPase [Candidatus Competibacteraceae bacterium]
MSSLDQSMLTGESMPVQKGEGDTIYGGTVNGNGSLLVRAVHVGKETLLAQIIRLVAQAQRSRAPIQTRVDQVAAYFVPLVFLISAATFLAWLFLTPEAEEPLAAALLSAVSVLIIACPCALGLATPMSIMVAIGRAAREGVLVKDAQTLEHLASIDTLVVDKTGTLTEGRFQVVRTLSLHQSGQAESTDIDSKTALALELASALERASEHPLAGAIVAHAKSMKKDDIPREATGSAMRADSVEAEPGGGITGYVSMVHGSSGQAPQTAPRARYLVHVGSPDFLAARLNLSPSWFEETLQSAQDATAGSGANHCLGATPVVVAIDGTVQMVLFLMDSLKGESRQTIDEFRKA